MLRASRLTLACLVALSGAAAVTGALPGRAAQARSSTQLLARYEPVVEEYASDWNPIRVEPYLAASDLERLKGTRWQIVKRHPAATALGSGSAGFRLDLRPCTPALNLDACYTKSAPRGRAAVYGRAWTNPGSGPIATVLEYWFFYPLNDWRNQLTKPTLWQMHEGDWEAVFVSLSSSGAPISVAASQHDLGVIRPWSRVRKVGATHPVVYSALGSHANYLSVGFHGQAGKPHRIPTRFSGVPLVEPDFTSGQTSYGPAGLAANVLEVVDVTDGAPWLGFAGAWGDGEFLLVGKSTPGGGIAYGHVSVGSSPTGPSFHRSWIAPLGPFGTWPADDGH
jgi:hypothetical protein